MSTDIELALSQLREAYRALARGPVPDQRQLAEGLIAPAIRRLESAALRSKTAEGSVEAVAKSLAQMVIEYIEGGIRSNQNWRNGLDAIIERRLQRLAALHKAGECVPGWRPIETAPKDGSYLIANDIGEVCPAQARDGSRTVSNMPGFADWTFGSKATDWMPLPAPPVKDKGE